jgi:hypothetical protein
VRFGVADGYPIVGAEAANPLKAFRIILHSLVLALADLAGILGGFMAYKALEFPQLVIQLPVAVAVSILLFLAWSILLPVRGGQQLRLLDLKELLLVFFGTAAWAPLVFVPLHFFTQGYWTAQENLVALALYQIPTNLISLCTVWIIQN